MKIGVYLEPSGRPPVPGGAERCWTTLAAALADRHHDVELVHHPPAIDLAHYSKCCGLDLSKVRSRCVEPDDPPLLHSSNPWTRYREARAWNAALSKPYDLFVAITPWLPPFCHARRGVLRITFPLLDRQNVWPWGVAWVGVPKWKHRLRCLYAEWEWRRRFAGYQAAAANSRFTERWVRRRWGIECSTVYPPVELDFPVREKRNLILSVGRFANSTPSKNQLEMILAFRNLSEVGGLDGWSYTTAGGLRDDQGEAAYVEKMRRAAAGGCVQILPNLDRERMVEMYGEAKVFWHAAGLGEDEEARPEWTEHFGIVTVEAMGAGCVPIVTRKGGQPEIVEHGVSGFLWNTLDELKEYTKLLARDEGLRVRMAQAARARAQRFSRTEFIDGMLALLRPLMF